MSKKIISILPQIIASLFLTGAMVFAWTEPSQTPPRENVPAPLNVGSVGQTKIGGLILNTGGAPSGLIIDKGKVGIGTQNPQDQLHLEAINAARLRLKETNSWETVLESAWQNTFNIWNSGAVQFTIKGDKVGIGITTPSEKLDVQGGGINTSGKLKESGNILVPSGAVMYFNLTVCPAGWTEVIAAQGRYLVGLPAGGNLGGTVGTGLTNLENRPVGQHNHGISDPGHIHSQGQPGGSAVPGFIGGYGFGFGNTGSANTGITINESGSVSGTNAPYLQFLVCQKN